MSTQTAEPAAPPTDYGARTYAVLGFFQVAFVIAAVALALGGIMLLSQATAGVGAIALGVLAAVFARMIQAGLHHVMLLDRLGRRP